MVNEMAKNVFNQHPVFDVGVPESVDADFIVTVHSDRSEGQIHGKLTWLLNVLRWGNYKIRTARSGKRVHALYVIDPNTANATLQRWVYQAWSIDDDGEADEGIEEEILAYTKGQAARKAWQRASHALSDSNHVGTIYMHHISRKG